MWSEKSGVAVRLFKVCVRLSVWSETISGGVRHQVWIETISCGVRLQVWSETSCVEVRLSGVE